MEARQGYANKREAEYLAKEALFCSNRLRNRLADTEAQCCNFVEGLEASKISCSWRKREQRKRFGFDVPAGNPICYCETRRAIPDDVVPALVSSLSAEGFQAEIHNQQKERKCEDLVRFCSSG
ncbi:hypothetical protein KQH41_02210 [bacterium]|nr:hypothetical protein [bacterium]